VLWRIARYYIAIVLIGVVWGGAVVLSGDKARAALGISDHTPTSTSCPLWSKYLEAHKQARWRLHQQWGIGEGERGNSVANWGNG